MSYEEWLDWRRNYFNLNNESSGSNHSHWENEGGSILINLPTGVYEGGHY